MTMTNWEIVRHYREALNRKADIRVLADLNATDKDAIIRILEDAGEIVPGAHRKRKLVDEILRLYKQGLSDREIADELGCTRNTVATYRSRNGLPCHRAKQTNRKGTLTDKMWPLYERGMTDRQISEELGCARANVAQWRLRRGLPPNGQSRRKSAGHQEGQHA